MNIIDVNFNKLVDELKSKSKDEIFEFTKDEFFKIDINIQNSIEDYFKKFPYWGKLDAKNEEYEHFNNKATALSDHLDDFIWLYNNLKDYRSKKLLYAILNNWYRYDFTTLDSSHEKNYPHYFDLDVINAEDEVFVDLGAYIGDTIYDYINTFGNDSYKKIYAYEMSDDNFKYLEENTKNFNNISLIKKAVSDKEETVFISENSVDSSANMIGSDGIKIDATSLDIDIKDKITMIKMDIEGSEQKALLGSINHIKNDRPKLLISVYHNNEDLWKIPRMIEDMVPNTYEYYLRSYGGSIYPTEIVLLATPEK